MLLAAERALEACAGGGRESKRGRVLSRFDPLSALADDLA